MTNQAHTRRDFCAKTFRLSAAREIQWFDTTGLVQLPKRRVAKLEVSESGHHDHYDTLVVTITSKDSGVIDRKSFKFNDYLKSRSDTRNDVETNFYVWAGGHGGGKFEWYIATPKIMEELMLHVEAYLKAWE